MRDSNELGLSSLHTTYFDQIFVGTDDILEYMCVCVCFFAINSLIITQKNQTNEYTEIMHLIRLQEESKMMFRTWNHLAWRRTARASRHFCLSKTSTGSFTIPEVTSKNEFQVSKW